MCEALLEFPEGRGVLEKIPPWGRYGYVLELHSFKFIDKTDKLFQKLFINVVFSLGSVWHEFMNSLHSVMPIPRGEMGVLIFAF